MEACQDKISDLLNLDVSESVSLFIEFREHLTPQTIVGTLLPQGMDNRLFRYLDALVKRDWDASKAFHNLLVQLYADYDTDKLLPFLQKSDHYKIQDALETAETHGLIQEKIFILARMGNTSEALNIINK